MKLSSVASTGPPAGAHRSAAMASQAGVLGRPLKAALVTGLMVVAIFVGMAVRASATEYSYCYHCQIFNGSAYADSGTTHYYTLSYHHYLWDAGTGQQGAAWIGAGEWNVGGIAHAWNETAHSYSGQYRSFVEATNDTNQVNEGRNIISNAHGDY
jgi:hypothetical protein